MIHPNASNENAREIIKQKIIEIIPHLNRIEEPMENIQQCTEMLNQKEELWLLELRAKLYFAANWYRECLDDWEKILKFEWSSFVDTHDFFFATDFLLRSNKFSFYHYSLGINDQTPFEAIKQKYKSLVKTTHPDKIQDDLKRPVFVLKQQMLNQAFEYYQNEDNKKKSFYFG